MMDSLDIFTTKRKTNWISLLIIISLINHSSSAVFFNNVFRDPLKGYEYSKSESVHRGELLSLSPDEKTEICRDLFSEYAKDNTVISDDVKNEGDSEHSLIVGLISYLMEIFRPEKKMEDIFFKCCAKNLAPGLDKEFLVSSTFQHGFMYNSAGDDKITEIMLRGYIGLSPKYVSSDQTQLERQYSATRQAIKTLSKESPEYMKKIEEQDDLSELSVWQKFLLCSSIILSPAHKEDRHKFPLNWVEYRKNIDKGIHRYHQKSLTFINDKNQVESWSADLLYCTSPPPTTEAARDPSKTKSNLILTRTYDNKHSLYIVIENKYGGIRFANYVENVPILMNSHVPFTNDPEHIEKFQLE